MFRRSTPCLAYTKWKCDRFFFYTLKKYVCDMPHLVLHTVIFVTLVNRYIWVSDETERKGLYMYGYPYWRDPIARRNEIKAKTLIKNNSIDILDPKWTGVPRSSLPASTLEA